MVEEQGMQEEPRDYTKWVWAGILMLIAVMLGTVWFSGQRDPERSTVTARHILIGCDLHDPADRQRAMALAAELRERILNGESMAKLAREYSSDDQSAARGGLLRPFTRRDQLDPNFANYAWTAPIGELSGILRTSFGFHLVKVEERHISEGDRYQAELERRAQEALTETPAGAPDEAVPSPNTGALPSSAVYQ